jgi:hypothetical protein
MDPELGHVVTAAWVITLLRNHPDWSSALISDVTGVDEAEVRQVRKELRSWEAQCQRQP